MRLDELGAGEEGAQTRYGGFGDTFQCSAMKESGVGEEIGNQVSTSPTQEFTEISVLTSSWSL
jgi:hypothetical protein